MQWDYRLFIAINNMASHNRFLDAFMVTIAKWGPILYGLILIMIFFGSKNSIRDIGQRPRCGRYGSGSLLDCLLQNTRAEEPGSISGLAC